MRLWALGQLYVPPKDQSDDTTDEAAAALGIQVLSPDDEDDEDGEEREAAKPDAHLASCYLWLCNVPVYNLWAELQTQWVHSMGGREGLNYDSVLRYMREVAHIRPRRVPEIFACIRAMERAALDAWSQQRTPAA